MPVSPPDGTPRCLYILARNNGYDVNNPDPRADNTPDLSPPDPADPNYYAPWQVMADIYVADDNSADPAADHRHFMPVSGMTHISEEAVDPHYHYSMVNSSGNQIWRTQQVSGAGGSASVEAYDVDGDGDTDIIIQPPPGVAAIANHDHEVVTQYVINSLGEEYYRMRPKWFLVLAKVNTWTHQHWTDNGGGRTIVFAERPYVEGDNADPGTWVFEAKPSNDAWDETYKNQINSFWISRFGLSIPIDDSDGEKNIENDRRLVEWWVGINRYQWQDSTRFG